MKGFRNRKPSDPYTHALNAKGISTKSWFVVDGGKIISKHSSFYLAQKGSEKGLKLGKLTNNYEIKNVRELK